jgi:hypothetical protein
MGIDWKNLKAHPAADMYPLMGKADLESLANNIRLTEQRFPVMLTPDGLILDGRNRIAAYKLPLLEGLEPWIETYTGPLTPMDYVRSVNWERMHLSQSQRTALAVLLLPDARRKAAERELAGKKALASTDAPVGKAVNEVATKMNVAPAQVERLAAVQKEAPEAFEKVKEGKSTVRAEHAKLPKKTKTTPKKPAPPTTLDKVLKKIQQSHLLFLDVPASEYSSLSDLDLDFYLDAFIDAQNALSRVVELMETERTRRAQKTDYLRRAECGLEQAEKAVQEEQVCQ